MAKIYIPTFGEEVGNSISHGVMSILMLLAMPFAAVWSYTHSGGDVLRVVGVSVFCISIFMMFLISTLYHSMLHDTRHKAPTKYPVTAGNFNLFTILDIINPTANAIPILNNIFSILSLFLYTLIYYFFLLK
ncbi:MAG: hemolysin III family protein [Spirochaetales bacterium]|nr:hemolysin III family protein [Spirochaetales bacterium]